jgi:hypothetical protein
MGKGISSEEVINILKRHGYELDITSTSNNYGGGGGRCCCHHWSDSFGREHDSWEGVQLHIYYKRFRKRIGKDIAAYKEQHTLGYYQYMSAIELEEYLTQKDNDIEELMNEHLKFMEEKHE